MKRRKRTRRDKYVMISVVAERFDIHPQTLRLYEREGLLTPARSTGNTRLYDDEALERIESILTLTRDMGINLAGVEVILKLREQLDRLEEENRRLRAALDEVDRESGASVRRHHALVRVVRGPLAQVARDE